MNDYERVARVIQYLDERHTDQPNLTTLARHVGLSQHHFHHLFTSWAGITPKDFLQCRTLAHAKELLQNGKSVLDATLGAGLSSPSRLHDLCVTFVRGTQFQVRVWRALLKVEPGTLVSYGGLATILNQPTAARAVGSAVGQNPLAYFIPCHRVIRETGALGGYRWGEVRKQAILAWENSPCSTSARASSI